MAKFNKEFTHKEHKFNMVITLHTKVERKLNGRVWHTIETSSIDDYYSMDNLNYNLKEEVEDFKLAQKITEHRNLAVKYVDDLTSKAPSEDEEFLFSLGFTKLKIT